MCFQARTSAVPARTTEQRFADDKRAQQLVAADRAYSRVSEARHKLKKNKQSAAAVEGLDFLEDLIASVNTSTPAGIVEDIQTFIAAQAKKAV